MIITFVFFNILTHKIRIQPGLAAMAGVLGEAGGSQVQLGHLGEQGTQAILGEVGEVAAAAFAARAAVFERGVKAAAGAQMRRQPAQHLHNLRRGQVQQRGAGPNAVEGAVGFVVLKPRTDHLLPQIGRRPLAQRWRAVHRHHLIAPLQKRLAVASRATAQVEKAAPRAHTRQKRLVQRAHVRRLRLRHKLLGAALVIGQRRRARAQPVAAHWNLSFKARRSALSIHSSE